MNKKLYYLTWIWTDLWIWESNPNDNDYFVLVKRLTYTVPGTITRSRKVCNVTEDRNIISQHLYSRDIYRYRSFIRDSSIRSIVKR